MQTTYNTNMYSARPGLLADSGYTEKLSRIVEAAGGLAAGIYVSEGTDPEVQVLAPTTAAEITGGEGGVLLYDATQLPGTNASSFEWDDEMAVPVLRKGRIWVRCDAAATPAAGDQAFVRYASGAGGTVLGTFRHDADTASAALLSGGRFASTFRDVAFFGTTYRVALLDLNLPNT